MSPPRHLLGGEQPMRREEEDEEDEEVVDIPAEHTGNQANEASRARPRTRAVWGQRQVRTTRSWRACWGGTWCSGSGRGAGGSRR